MDYAQVASLAVIAFLCILLFFIFRSNLKIVLLLVAITELFSVLAGGFWNTAVVNLALLFVSFLKRL
uniref:Uncharacterized protein n=1 Tax=Trichobilharzia regenti TaxID=157069 RepID=A0AA85IYK9_TRIRE|nr:unnamed protein product [Trichobilharzia regenti]